MSTDRIVVEEISDELMEEYIGSAREMVMLREQKARLEKVEADLKKALMNFLEEYGEPYGPEGQHRTVEFPESIRGIARFVRQYRVSSSVNETEAEAIARRKGIYNRLFKPVMALDEGAVLVAVAEGLISDAELGEIFPKKVTHAFVMEKEKK